MHGSMVKVEPSPDNLRTIRKLYSLIEPLGTETLFPIFYGYIERPVGAFKKSLLEALSEPEFSDEEIRAMVKEIRQMSQKRAERLAENEAKSKVILSEESKKKILEDNLLSIYRGYNSTMQTIEERFCEVDWHQGDIVDSGQTNALLDASIDKRPSTTKDRVLCVVSQDCDIIASTDKEPLY